MQAPRAAASQPLRWPYDEFNVHHRTLFTFIMVFAVLFLVGTVFIYMRWVCQFSASHSHPAPLSSAPFVLRFPPQPSQRRGLDLCEIEKMPIELYQKLAAGGGGKFCETECCIYLGVFTDKERVKMLPQCRHCFHSECLDRWLTTRSNCPLCRASLRVDSRV